MRVRVWSAYLDIFILLLSVLLDYELEELLLLLPDDAHAAVAVELCVKRHLSDREFARKAKREGLLKGAYYLYWVISTGVCFLCFCSTYPICNVS